MIRDGGGVARARRSGPPPFARMFRGRSGYEVATKPIFARLADRTSSEPPGMDLPESLKAALGTAGGGAGAATSAVDAAVSSAVASASKLTAVAVEAVNDRVEFGRAHLEVASWELQSAEDKFFKAPSRALASAIERAPYATAAAGAALALLAVPGTRRILWHASFGRMQSEEALVRAAARSAETLKAASEGTSSELARLREAAVAAEEEMTRGRGKLRQAAAELKRLVRARSSQNKTPEPFKTFRHHSPRPILSDPPHCTSDFESPRRVRLGPAGEQDVQGRTRGVVDAPGAPLVAEQTRARAQNRDCEDRNRDGQDELRDRRGAAKGLQGGRRHLSVTGGDESTRASRAM